MGNNRLRALIRKKEGQAENRFNSEGGFDLILYVDQGDVDLTRDGTSIAPFYYIREALEYMNAHKIKKGIGTHDVKFRTKIIVTPGNYDAVNVRYYHSESLIITPDYYNVTIEGSPGYGTITTNNRQVHWTYGDNNPDYTGSYVLPSIMITNLTRESFIQDFINSIGTPTYPVTTNNLYDTNYLWKSINLTGTVHPSASFNDTFYRTQGYASYLIEFNNFQTTTPTTYLPVDKTRFDSYSYIIAARANSNSYGTIGEVKFKNCYNINLLCKNASRIEFIDTNFAGIILDNCWAVTSQNASYLNFRSVNKSYTDITSSGAPRSLDTTYNEVLLETLANSEPQSIFANNFYSFGATTQPRANVFNFKGSGFNLTGSCSSTGHTFYVRHEYIDATINTSGNYTCNKVLCRNTFTKSGTGTTTLKDVTIGSTLTINAGTFEAYHGVFEGNVVVNGGTAKLTGLIQGNLTVAAGATLDAIDLKVKGAVTLSPTSVLTKWKGGFIVGGLTDTGSKLGAYTLGSYINV